MDGLRPTLELIWNKSFDRPLEPVRSYDYIRSSDLGKPFIDRYLKMTGVAPTNHFPNRVLRIFQAGNEFERMVLRIFAMAGILKDRQVECKIEENDSHIAILGHLDGIVGGIIDWKEADQRLEKWRKEFGFDSDLEFERAKSFITRLQDLYGDRPLEEQIIEIKSINSLSFWAHKNRTETGAFIGYDHHKLQLLSYMIATGIPRGSLIYISKDDLCIQEVPVFRTQSLEEKLFTDAERMSNFIRNKVEPAPEDKIVYNDRKKKFELNWAVGRSQYLTHAYGYADEEAFAIHMKPELKLVNMAWRRFINGKPKDLDQHFIKQYDFAAKVKK